MDPQSEDLFFWLWSPVPMQLLWQEEELNKQDQIAQADGEWAVAIATPLHHFSPESRSLILDAGSDWKSDLAGPGKWQTVKALVTMGNPEWVSWPDGIYTVPSFEICGSCEKGIWVVENISRGWSTFYAFTSDSWADRNRRWYSCTGWNLQGQRSQVYMQTSIPSNEHVHCISTAICTVSCCNSLLSFWAGR